MNNNATAVPMTYRPGFSIAIGDKTRAQDVSAAGRAKIITVFRSFV
jgi:hypothetical protein